MQDKFQTVGRICCDASSGARLNASSILLEGTKEISSGQSVPLDVSMVKEYSFFPGQIVAVEGSNPTGKKIVVNAVTTPSVNPTPKTDISFSGLNVIIAIAWGLKPTTYEPASVIVSVPESQKSSTLGKLFSH